MGVAKKLGIVILLYFIIGIVFSIMIWQGYLPEAGGLEGPLNALYIIFQPPMLVFFMLLGSLGML